MKKILVVNKSFEAGGIQTSMVNLVNELQKEYQIDLFIYYPEGSIKERLNSTVRVLPTSWRFQAIGMPIQEVLKSKSLRLILYRAFAVIWTKLFNNILPIRQAIKHQPKLCDYDIAIAFHQEQRKHSVASGFTRVVDECVESKKKFAWLHYDNTAIDLDSKFNNPFYKKMDKLVFVSRSLAQSFVKQFPAFKGKTDYCYNFIDYEDVIQMSKMAPRVQLQYGNFICFSACRLSREKAIVRAIHALKSVFLNHSEIRWYIAGDGPEKDAIKEAISEAHLGKQIILIGYQKNPYSYMSRADVLINVSYHEAAPMVFLEAKAIGIPVFATHTASAAELLQDGVDAFICENNEDGIRKRFEELINHKYLIQSAKKVLQSNRINNDSAVNMIRTLLEQGD